MTTFDTNKMNINKWQNLKIVDFGVFVKLNDLKDGLVHRTRMSPEIQNTINTVYSVGQIVKVRIEKIIGNKIELKILED